MKKNTIYVVGGIVLFILVLIIIALYIQSSELKKQQEREAEQERQLKEFCDNLELDIRESGVKLGLGSAGIMFSTCANKVETAIMIVNLKDGTKIEEEKHLDENACHLEQLDMHISPDEIDSIELKSTTCPNVRDLVIDVKRIMGETDMYYID